MKKTFAYAFLLYWYSPPRHGEIILQIHVREDVATIKRFDFLRKSILKFLLKEDNRDEHTVAKSLGNCGKRSCLLPLSRESNPPPSRASGTFTSSTPGNVPIVEVSVERNDCWNLRTVFARRGHFFIHVVETFIFNSIRSTARCYRDSIDTFGVSVRKKLSCPRLGPDSSCSKYSILYSIYR